MIVPMMKYTFLAYHMEYDQFLKDLQELGVLHVVEKVSGEFENDELKESYTQLKQYNDSITFLEKRDIEKTDASGGKEGIDILQSILKLQKEKEEYLQKLTVLKKELSIVEPWGEFSWDALNKLENAGLNVRFFTCPSKKFEESIEGQYYSEVINELNGLAYFVLIEKQDEKIDIDLDEFHLPEKSLSKVLFEIDDIEKIIIKTEEVFDKYASKYLTLLKKSAGELAGKLSFDKIILNTQKEAEEKLMVLEGWVPKDKVESLNSFLDKSGAYYESEKPIPGEIPPIKLKNNKFAKLYEAIGELYTFPNYQEIDLTAFFAPFYMLFFGFCLGDAGYGLLITLGTIYGLFKVKPKLKPLLKLGMYLGIATTIMGIIGGTFFGIMLHPKDFGEASNHLAPWLQRYQGYILSSDNLMIISLVIGYIQVLFGMFLNAANRIRLYGFKFAISQFGWNIIALLTVPALLLSSFNLIPSELAMKIALISGIIGGIPALFYNSPGKNPLLNLGTGLWEGYQVASGLLGDVLSYIRLFALGLSSAILGNVFNQLAMQSSEGVGGGIVGVLIMVVILAFGHGLNFFMAALGSFVHPLRLTFVEFYKNAGFMGGGRKYEPFRK